MFIRSLSRRGLLQASAAAGAAALAPATSLRAQTTKVLKARAYFDAAILDPGDRQGVVEEEIMSAVMGGRVRLKAGNVWTWE